MLVEWHNYMYMIQLYVLYNIYLSQNREFKSKSFVYGIWERKET